MPFGVYGEKKGADLFVEKGTDLVIARAQRNKSVPFFGDKSYYVCNSTIMSDVERMTITLTAEIASAVKSAVATGEYASNSEIVREALRHWRRQRELQKQELAMLRADIQTGMRDIEEGRVHDFDADRIAQKGRQRLNTPEPSE